MCREDGAPNRVEAALDLRSISTRAGWGSDPQTAWNS
jgi:hypothetical protein